jgi:FkbM family methyltransferase
MMAWTYANSAPSLVGSTREWKIRFRFKPPIDELVFVVRNNNGSDRFIFSEVFQHFCYDIPLGQVPVSVLDLGANCGFSAAFFARSYPGVAIACVEPMPGNCLALRRNLALNNIAAHVIEAAIDVEDGTLSMLQTRHDYGSKVVEQGKMNQADCQPCAALSVHSVMSSMKWNRIGLAKIDIEGYEKTLLSENTDWLSDTDAVVIECHPGFGIEELRGIAKRYAFEAPRQRAGLWLLNRK